MDHLPLAILDIIASRLSFKPLTRLRSSCKELHTNESLKRVADDFIDEHTSNLVLVSTPGRPREEQPVMIGSCNGLICLWDDYEDAGMCILMNPVLEEVLCLRTSIPIRHGGTLLHLGIFATGLGYDRVSGDYKVVMVPDLLLRLQTRSDDAMVYNLGTRSWRHVRLDPENGDRHEPRGIGIFHNGALYWLESYPDYDMTISFLLSEEEFVCFPNPGKGSRNLVDLGNRLGLVQFSTSGVINLWELDDHSNEWVHTWKVGLKVPWRLVYYDTKIMGVWKHQVLVWHEDGLYCYNRRTKEARTVPCSDLLDAGAVPCCLRGRVNPLPRLQPRDGDPRVELDVHCDPIQRDQEVHIFIRLSIM